jgi:hypothetical protein
MTASKYLLRLVHEFFFMFNLVLVARLTEGLRDFWPFRYLFMGSWETKLEFGIESDIFHRSHPNVPFASKDLPGHTAFLLVTLGIALAGAAILAFLSRTRFVKELLRSVAGLASVLMLPVSWLYVTRLYPEYSVLPSLARPWLYVELIVSATAIFVYVFAPRFLPDWSLVVLLLTHHLMWGWLFLGGPYFWRSPFLSLLPATGLCASIAWLVYISHQRGGWHSL